MVDKRSRENPWVPRSLVVSDRLKARIEQKFMKIGFTQSDALISIKQICWVHFITLNPSYLSVNKKDSDFFHI